MPKLISFCYSMSFFAFSRLCGKLFIMDDKKAAIIKILEMAIIEEIKAKNFYFKMSAQLANKEAQSRFRHMAEAEQEHEDILKAWYEETCGYPFDVSKAQSKEYKLDITEPEHNATFLDILKLIAKVENKAFHFYKDAALLARTQEENGCLKDWPLLNRCMQTNPKSKCRWLQMNRSISQRTTSPGKYKLLKEDEDA